MTKVLGFDLSTRCGWALFASASSAPRFGTYRLPKPYNPEDYGARCWPLMEFVEGMIEGHAPELIAFESPFIPMGPTKGDDGLPGKPSFTTTQHALRLQISLATVIEMAAKKHRVECIEVATSSAKVALAGTARLGKEKKRAMVIAASRRGWNIADDHQADAGAVCLVAYDHLGEA